VIDVGLVFVLLVLLALQGERLYVGVNIKLANREIVAGEDRRQGCGVGLVLVELVLFGLVEIVRHLISQRLVLLNVKPDVHLNVRNIGEFNVLRLLWIERAILTLQQLSWWLVGASALSQARE